MCLFKINILKGIDQENVGLSTAEDYSFVNAGSRVVSLKFTVIFA